jgi:hypothetical protein
VGEKIGDHARMTEQSDSPREGHLVQLLIQQGNVFSSWVKFAITVQGGLVAGLGAVLLSGLSKYRGLGVIIASFGIAAAVLFAKILLRHTQWAAWYVRRGRELDKTPQIFPQSEEILEVKLRELTELKKWKELGPVIRAILMFHLIMVIGWVVILVWLPFLDNEARYSPPNPAFNTWNNCPLSFTVQNGLCKPYRGP